MNSKVSIIIPCYNAEKTISKCLKSIFNSISNFNDLYSFEIIVINDGSNDQTLSIVKEFDEIKIINHNKNLGLSSARNAGIKATDSEYIIFIDSDIILSANWVTDMITTMNKDNNIIGIIGNLESSAKENISVLDKYLFGKYRGMKVINIDQPLDYRSFVFSNTIIKRSILNTVGVFDDSLKNYGGEDTELAIRIHKKAPYSMRKLITVTGYHITHKTVQNHLDHMFEYGKYNFHKIIQKHPAYRNELGYRWTTSFWRGFLFNSLNVLICSLLLKKINNSLLVKFLVINSFIKGARASDIK